MNFVALDFETANEHRSSACSVGLVKVVNGVIVDSFYSLIKPEPFIFNVINSKKHLIKEQDCVNAPSLSEVWNKEIQQRIVGLPVIAHNASFDISVLINSLKLNSAIIGPFQYACSLFLSKYFLKDLPNHKLSTICTHLNIPLEHHNALSDARACAELLIHFFTISNCSSLESLFEVADCSYGFVNSDLTYNKFNSRGKRIRSTSYGSKQPSSGFDIDLQDYIDIWPDIFQGKRVVISGTFYRIPRPELEDFINITGGLNSSSVSNKTDLIIAGDKMGPSKLEKATQLGIKIISEEEFIQMITN